MNFSLQCISVYSVNTNEKLKVLAVKLQWLQVHTNVRILFYAIKSGEGILQCIAFSSIRNELMVNNFFQNFLRFAG